MCRPKVMVAIRSNHGTDVLSVLGNLHQCKFFAIQRKPFQERLATFSAVLYPVAFSMIKIEPGNLVHNTEGGRQSGRKDGAATAKSSPYAHGTGWRKSRPAGFLGIIASWSQRKMGSTAIAIRKPLAGQPCLIPLAM